MRKLPNWDKTRYRSIVSMGKLGGAESREDKKLLTDTIEALVHEDVRLAFFDENPDISRHAKEFAKRIKDKNTIWKIYNTLTEIEATFRCLKTDLAWHPVFHKYDENIESHLFLGLLAYQVVATQ